MKKLRNIILSLVMAVTLSACNAANEIPTPTVTAKPTPAVQATQTPEYSPPLNKNIQANETATEYSKGMYIGNKNSKKLHRPDCWTLPAEKNRIEFSSRAEAINAGYSPCGNCLP